MIKEEYKDFTGRYQKAIFSNDKLHRYGLLRYWAEGEIDCNKIVVFLLLNPSTADAFKDDPTIRRCINYAIFWGYNGVYILNIFAFRQTSPALMKLSKDPIGEENDKFIKNITKCCGLVVCGWGNHGDFLNRSDQVKETLKDIDLYCLGVSKSGQPLHPLYLKKDKKLELYNKRSEV